MKQTEPYGLNQWELSDRIQMKDFNADNAKIAGELGELRRIVTSMAYHLGQLSLVDGLNRNMAFSTRAVYYDIFSNSQQYTLSGGVTVADNRAKLTGKGAQGSVLAQRYFLYVAPNSKNLKLWLHHRGGSVAVSINGTPAAAAEAFLDTSPSGGTGTQCQAYTWTGPLSNSYQIKLEMDCGNDSSMEVYDFVMAFL